jgi:hypothetical protein
VLTGAEQGEAERAPPASSGYDLPVVLEIFQSSSAVERLGAARTFLEHFRPDAEVLIIGAPVTRRMTWPGESRRREGRPSDCIAPASRSLPFALPPSA